MSTRRIPPLLGAVALGLLFGGCGEDPSPPPTSSQTPTVTNLDGTPTPSATPSGTETEAASTTAAPTPSPQTSTEITTPTVTPVTPTTQPPTPTLATPTPTGLTPTEDVPTPTGATPTNGPATPTPTPTQAPTQAPTSSPKPTPLPNQAPLIEMTSPLDGSTFSEGQGIDVIGVVSDPESLPQDLTIALESSLSGPLGAPIIEEDGSFHITLFSLISGEHTLTATATDPVLATGMDTLVVTIEAVDGAPLIEIISPTVERVQAGDEVAFSFIVTDPDGSEESLNVVVDSSIDGQIFSGMPGEGGSVAFEQTHLSRGNHQISITATDDDSNSTQAALDLTVNGAPSIPNITITPELPNTTSIIFADATATDIENDDLTYAYVWSLEGVSGDYTEATLPASATERGQVWTVAVVASDPDVSGEEGTVDVTIGNSPPTSVGATLSPNDATALSTLTCEGMGFSDADSDDEGWRYAWLVNGEAVLGVDAMTLSGAFTRGDSVQCQASPQDGIDTGAPQISNTIVIQNSPPTVGTVTLLPFEGATEESTLTCDVGTVRDGDGDDTSILLQWLNGGSVIDGQASETLTGEAFNKGDTLVCRVTPNDGIEDGSFETSNAVTIENSLPRMLTVAITPDSPSFGDTLTCESSSEDPDPSDSVTLTYQWTLDDAVVSGESDMTFSASLASRGQAIRCEVTPFDGSVSGEALVSEPVSLDNQAPSIESVSLLPEEAQENTTLTCIPNGFSDPEDDEATYLYTWTVAGEDIDADSNKLTGDDFNKGDAVQCHVTPSDGFAEGDAVSSQTVTILNTVPVVDRIEILPSSPTLEKTLSCEVQTSDADDNDVDITLTYTWAVDESILDGQNAATLEAGNAQSGQSVTCSATPNDGEMDGLTQTSEAVEVGNLAPSDPEITIVPPSPLPGQALEAVITTESVDPDGQAVSYIYVWSRNGETQDIDTATVPSFTTLDGDTWQVTVKGSDGSAESEEVVASVDVFETDNDGDGYGAFSDCDDDNANIHPGATEATNGVDDDCDGDIDNRWLIQYPYGHEDSGQVSAIDVYTPGMVQMVYLDSSHSRVQYARVEDDAVLFVDTVDGIAIAGSADARPLDISVDDQDIPHVVIADTDSGEILYATLIQGKWQSMLVATDAGPQPRPRIAVDVYGLVHILYRAIGGRLNYGRGFFGLFDVQEVSSGLIGDAFHDLDSDADGNTHMAWRVNLGGDLYYAAFDGETLTSEPIVTAVNAGVELRLRVDEITNDVHMAYVNDSTGNVTHIVGQSGDWSGVSVASIGALQGPLGLAINPATGSPHILAHGGDDGVLYHLFKESRGWQNDVAGNFGGPVGVNPAATMDTNQRILLSAYDGERGHLLYGSAPEASEWSFAFYSIDSYDLTGNTNDVALTSNGLPVIYTTAENVDTATKTSLALSYVPEKGFLSRSPNSAATTFRLGQVAIGEDDTRHILEWDPSNTTLALISSPTGETWSRQVLANDLYSSGGIALATTDVGGVFVAFTDYYGSLPLLCGLQTPYYTTLTLTHRASSDESFDTDIIGYACSASTALPISETAIVATDDSLHIALYKDSSGDLLYLGGDLQGNFDGAALAIDSTGDTGSKPSIAVNPFTGQPGIVSINNDTGSIRYSTRGVAGVWLTISTDQLAPNGPLELAYDTTGSAHMFFKDEGGDRMVYSTNRSGLFVTEPILIGADASAFGSSGDMVLDENGNPHITFYDADYSDLVYAKGRLY